MADTDDKPTADTNPAPPPDVHWHTYKLRALNVATSVVAGKYVRVQEIGNGEVAIEVEGLEPILTYEQFAICQTMAEKTAYAGRLVRRFSNQTTGEDDWR